MPQKASRDLDPPAAGWESQHFLRFWHWLATLAKADPALTLVIIVAAALQGWFFSLSYPNQFPDTGVYFQTATALRTGDWNYSHFAYRTPGFPGFLALGQVLFGERGFVGIMGMQFFLGLAFAPMLYLIFRRLTDLKWAAAAGALLFYGDRFSVGMQTVLLTEWLSAWSALLVLVVYIHGVERKTVAWAILAGAVCALNILIRPSFSLLPLFLALGTTGVQALYRDRRSELPRIAAWNAGVVAGAYLFTLPWRLFLYSKFGHLTLSFILGVSLSNHMGAIMEKAPDSDAEIRDLYVQLRPKTGSPIDTGWGVLWEYERRTGHKHTEAALKLQSASVHLIQSNPGLYFHNLADGWSRIWEETPFYVTDLTDPYTTPAGMERTAFYRGAVLTGPTSSLYQSLDRNFWGGPGRLMLIPYLLILTGGVMTWFNRQRVDRVTVIWILIGTIFYHVAIHIAANYTEFGRYRLPVQPLWFSFLGFTLCLSVAHAVLYGRSVTNTLDESEPEVPGAGQVPSASGPSGMKVSGGAGQEASGSGKRKAKAKRHAR